MVLEYVEGITLRAWIDHQWQRFEPMASSDVEPLVRVSMRQALSLITPVVRALVHAHALGMVHRDLKPENIMLAEDGPLKVLDFGIAKILGDEQRVPQRMMNIRWLEEAKQSHTRTGFLTGTLPYMSPEQWNADGVDEQSDLWAVGVIFAEILTGRHPLEPLSLGRLSTVRDLDVPMPSIRERYPQFAAVARVIDQCLTKDKSKRLQTAESLLQALEDFSEEFASLTISVETANGANAHPFVGLAPYEEGDASRFFGRDREIGLMHQKLRHNSLVTVIGPSGAGKSSFVRAGVLTALKRSNGKTETYTMRPGPRAVDSLAKLLLSMTVESDPQELEARTVRLHKQPGMLGAAIRDHCRKMGCSFVLFIDQFEELYTLETDLDARRLFVSCIGGLIDDVSLPIRVVIALRSDFLDRVAEDRGFSREVLRGLMLLSPLSKDELKQALTCPLHAVDYAFESDALVDEMLAALRSTKSPLPLLQFAAAKLWELRDTKRRCLTQKSYREMGGVAGALAFHADGVLAHLSSEEQKVARFVLTRLVTLERARTPSSLTALRAQAPSSLHLTIERVVERLVDARLLRTEGGAEQGPVIELSHESLIERWPLLVEWLSEDQDEARFIARLQNASREWAEHGRSTDLLWRGVIARQARRWLEQWQSEGQTRLAHLQASERAYLHGVMEAQTKAQRRSQYLIAAVIGALCTVLVVVVTLALQAQKSARQADAQAALADKEARRARDESIVARNSNRMSVAREHFSDPTLVLALVREVEPRFLPARWASLAHRALQRGPAAIVYEYAEPVLFAGFSPDGRKVVNTTANGRVIARSLYAKESSVAFLGHTDDVYAASISPDGRHLVTACWDGEARIYDFKRGGDPIVRLPHADAVLSAAHSSDGQWMATSSKDGSVRIYRADGRQAPKIFRDHEAAVWSVAFSPDSARVVSASADGTVRIQNIDGKGAPIVLRGHSKDVVSAAFSPDGRFVVTASWDKTARLFALEHPHKSHVLPGHRSLVTSAAFSPDGQLLVTSSADKMLRVYTTRGAYLYAVLSGPVGQINSASFSPDGRYIVAASSDGTVRLYATIDPTRLQVLRGHRDTLYSASFSANGRWVATASADRTARIFDVAGRAPPKVFSGHSGAVWSAVFDPETKRLITTSADGTARIQNIDRTGQPVVLSGHTDTVFSAVFSGDGRYVVTASGDKTARLYHVNGKTREILTGHTDAVYSAVFSPDDRHILTASRDGTARLYRVDGAEEPRILSGSGQALTSAAFSSDGQQIATASWDKSVRVYRLDSLAHPVHTFRHDGVASVGRPGAYTFDPAGERILSFAEDRTIRLWSLLGADTVRFGRQRFDPWAVSLSADGAQMVSASHPELSDGRPSPDTGFTAWVWKDIRPLITPNDARLWRATTYCPSVARRMSLLGISEARAQEEFRMCLQRVEEVRGD
ncbi:MAG: protein kinase [Myxococcota bacterium]